MGKAPCILLTDAEERSVVAACRALADAGFRVAAAAGTRLAPAHWSRACHERLFVPNPVESPEEFTEELARAARRAGYVQLLPGSDAALLAISRNRGLFEPHVRLGLPPHPAVLRSVDKIDLADAARRAGLPLPETVICDSVDDAVQAALRLGFPVVLKARRSVVDSGGGLRLARSLRLEDAAALKAVALEYGTPCLVQGTEQGAVISFGGVLAEGRLLGVAVSRYVRTWYPDAGSVCFSESIEPPAGVADSVSRLLGVLQWEGLFELEMIERPDGSFAPIDFNPRVYGSLALAVAAGANLPALWCRHILGRRDPVVTARPGVRFRWEDAELRHLLWQLRRGRVRKALTVLRPHRKVVHAYIRLGDPGPLVARGATMLRTVFRRGRRARSVDT
jgi:predicted ATP-grasp superfamily ATP-dependent carboligase